MLGWLAIAIWGVLFLASVVFLAKTKKALQLRGRLNEQKEAVKEADNSRKEVDSVLDKK